MAWRGPHDHRKPNAQGCKTRDHVPVATSHAAEYRGQGLTVSYNFVSRLSFFLNCSCNFSLLYPPRRTEEDTMLSRRESPASRAAVLSGDRKSTRLNSSH